MPRKPKTAKGNALAVRIGANIKSARTFLGMTQENCAELLEIESVTISRIETGAQMPSIDRLDEIAKVLNVPLAALLVDTSKSTAIAEVLVEVMKDLPIREQKFLCNFAATYALHFKAGKKK